MTTKRVGLPGVIVLILTAILGIRWIPVAGSIGPSSIIFWILGALLFFIPLSLIVMELANNFTEDGGVYLWIKAAIGEKWGFFTAWLYWVNNLFFYPGLLIFMVANFAYLVGNKTLANNYTFIISSTIILLWLAIIVNIMGVKFIARIAAFACALNIGLGVFIIVTGFTYWIIFHHSSTNFSWSAFLPQASLGKNLSNLTLLMFGLSGVELIPIMAGSINNPNKTLRRGVVISGLIVMISYILGTLAINVIMSPTDLNNTTGLMESLVSITNKMHMWYLDAILVVILLLVEFGALVVWLIAPTIMFFECVPRGVLPKWLQKLNKQNIPGNALLAIGVLVTVIVMLTQYLPTINSIFTALVLMGTIVYFLPYLFLAVAYLKLKRNGKLTKSIISQPVAYICAFLLFASVLLGLVLSFAPSSDIKTQHDLIVYELELFLGPVLFIGSGYLLYRRYKK